MTPLGRARLSPTWIAHRALEVAQLLDPGIRKCEILFDDGTVASSEDRGDGDRVMRLSGVPALLCYADEWECMNEIGNRVRAWFPRLPPFLVYRDRRCCYGGAR